MLNLKLHIQPKTERQLRAILNRTQDQEIFAQNIIAYEIAELRRAILNISLDLKAFEEKYQLTSDIFYQQFSQGLLDDSEDFMIWSGL